MRAMSTDAHHMNGPRKRFVTLVDALGDLLVVCHVFLSSLRAVSDLEFAPNALTCRVAAIAC